MVAAWRHIPANLALLASKNENINLCVMRLKKVNEELNTDSDDEMDLENERETVNEESSNEKSQSESETSGASVDGWKEVMETQGIHIY
jgi:hypothetical protein